MQKRILLLVVSSIIGICIFVVVATFVSIYIGVRRACIHAQQSFDGDCVTSLLSVLESEKTTFSDKNTAIWALGQLADSRALPALKKLFTGKIPEKESYDDAISQYELKKAIIWCEHGNSTRFMYKNQESWK